MKFPWKKHVSAGRFSSEICELGVFALIACADGLWVLCDAETTKKVIRHGRGEVKSMDAAKHAAEQEFKASLEEVVVILGRELKP